MSEHSVVVRGLSFPVSEAKAREVLERWWKFKGHRKRYMRKRRAGVPTKSGGEGVTVTVADVEAGAGDWVLLDLPVPLEPVMVDRSRPLEEQLPAGRYLEAAKKMLEEAACQSA